MKEEKIKLSHPAGKKSISISVQKYEVMKKAIMHCLAKKQALTHTELYQQVQAYLLKNKISFEGAVEWYLEMVKLDLEANKLITRFNEGAKLLFKISEN